MKDSNLIPYACHDITDADIAAVVTALQGEMIAPGPAVEAFESDLAANVGARHAVAFNSGTAALHAAYFAAGIGPLDAVVTSPITFAATSNAALYLGAQVQFVDVDPITALLDIDRVPLANRYPERVAGGVDAAFSLEPAEMTALVEESARAFASLGQARPGRTASESASMQFRRSLYFVKDVAAGERITEDNVRAVRPGWGLPLRYQEAVIGMRVSADVRRGTPVSWDVLR